MSEQRDDHAAVSPQGTDLAVRTLVLPLAGLALLVPNAAVAEVVRYVAPEAVPDSPEWLLGLFRWRELRVPVVSFEAASGGACPEFGKQARIAVLYTLNANPKLPYFAVATQGIPQLLTAKDDTLQPAEQVVADGPAVASTVILQGRPAAIPDLDNLEERLLKLSGGEWGWRGGAFTRSPAGSASA